MVHWAEFRERSIGIPCIKIDFLVNIKHTYPTFSDLESKLILPCA
jgi:hypothetical protein